MNRSATDTPEQVRAAANARMKRAMLRAEPECDPGWRGVFALTVGVSRQRVDQWMALDHDANMPAALISFLPKPMRLAAMHEMMSADEAITDLPVATEAADDWRLVASAQRETGQAITAMCDAVADGRITATEGASLERECTEGIASLLGIRERARAAQRERVIGLRAVSR